MLLFLRAGPLSSLSELKKNGGELACKLLKTCDGGSSKSVNTFTDSRDGKKYKMVKIGNQTWMAENLNYNASGSKCYKNNESNCQKYGRLYNWSTAKSACPSGWHLPSGDELNTLANFAGGYDVAGEKLKATSGWDKNGNGTDDYGFSALPGGGSGSNGDFASPGDIGYWWSVSEGNNRLAYNLRILYEYESLFKDVSDKSYLFSVRCIKD